MTITLITRKVAAAPTADVEPTAQALRENLVDRHLQEMFVYSADGYRAAPGHDLYSPLEIIRRVVENPPIHWARDSYRPMFTELNAHLLKRGLGTLSEDGRIRSLTAEAYNALREFFISCKYELQPQTDQERSRELFRKR